MNAKTHVWLWSVAWPHVCCGSGIINLLLNFLSSGSIQCWDSSTRKIFPPRQLVLWVKTRQHFPKSFLFNSIQRDHIFCKAKGHWISKLVPLLVYSEVWKRYLAAQSAGLSLALLPLAASLSPFLSVWPPTLWILKDDGLSNERIGCLYSHLWPQRSVYKDDTPHYLSSEVLAQSRPAWIQSVPNKRCRFRLRQQANFAAASAVACATVTRVEKYA